MAGRGVAGWIGSTTWRDWQTFGIPPVQKNRRTSGRLNTMVSRSRSPLAAEMAPRRVQCDTVHWESSAFELTTSVSANAGAADMTVSTNKDRQARTTRRRMVAVPRSGDTQE